MVSVVSASGTPVIVQDELTEVRILSEVASTEVTLNTKNMHKNLAWSWVDRQSMSTARFRVQNGGEGEVAESSQNVTVVLYVSEALNEALFTICG